MSREMAYQLACIDNVITSAAVFTQVYSLKCLVTLTNNLKDYWYVFKIIKVNYFKNKIQREVSIWFCLPYDI